MGRVPAGYLRACAGSPAASSRGWASQVRVWPVWRDPPYSRPIIHPCAPSPCTVMPTPAAGAEPAYGWYTTKLKTLSVTVPATLYVLTLITPLVVLADQLTKPGLP